MHAEAIEHFEGALKLAADAHVPRSQSTELKADIESKLDAVKKDKAVAVRVAEEAQSHVAAAKQHVAEEDFEASMASYESALERAREAKSLGETIASEAIAEISVCKQKIDEQVNNRSYIMAQIRNDRAWLSVAVS